MSPLRLWRSLVAGLALCFLLLVLVATPAQAPQIELHIERTRPAPMHVSRDRKPPAYPRACWTTPVVEIGCVRTGR